MKRRVSKINVPGVGGIEGNIVSGVAGAVEEVGAEGETKINRVVANLMGLMPGIVDRIRNWLELKEKAKSTSANESKE